MYRGKRTCKMSISVEIERVVQGGSEVSGVVGVGWCGVCSSVLSCNFPPPPTLSNLTRMAALNCRGLVTEITSLPLSI